jgi:hypothetical protein
MGAGEGEAAVSFDWTINIAVLISAISMILALFAIFYGIKSDIRSIDARLTHVEASTRNQTSMDAKIFAEIGMIRQNTAVLMDRLEPPPVSVPPYPPTKGAS